MKRSYKISLCICITCIILAGAGTLGYEVLEMGMNSSAAQAMSQPNNLKASFIHQLFADITPVAQSSTAITALPQSDTGSKSSLDESNQSDTSKSTLHFSNQQDALKFAMKKFSPTELVSIMNDLTHPDQVTPQQVNNLKQIIESRFTHEELLALKEALDTN